MTGKCNIPEIKKVKFRFVVGEAWDLDSWEDYISEEGRSEGFFPQDLMYEEEGGWGGVNKSYPFKTYLKDYWIGRLCKYAPALEKFSLDLEKEKIEVGFKADTIYENNDLYLKIMKKILSTFRNSIDIKTSIL